MSYTNCILFLVFSAFVFPRGVVATTLAISELEANQRVATEVFEKASREATLKAKIESFPALDEWEKDLGDRKIALRRIAFCWLNLRKLLI
jgi:predicted acyltransferase